MEWIDINDKLPEFDKNVLIITNLYNEPTITHAYLRKDYTWHEVNNYTSWSADWGHGGGDNEIYDPVIKWAYLPPIQI